MKKHLVEHLETALARAYINPVVFRRDLDTQVADEEERILGDIAAITAGAMSRRVEVASYNSGNSPSEQYIGHSAILGVLRKLGYEDDYYAATVEPISVKGLLPHVLENGWELALPMREGVRPIVRSRPGDEGGYSYSLFMYYQGSVNRNSKNPVQAIQAPTRRIRRRGRKRHWPQQ